MSRLSTIELFKEGMNFAVGHFTVFSSTVRENLHGHNYHLYVAFTTTVEDEGLSFDYRLYKAKLYKLCENLNEAVLLPGRCKYLTITEEGDYYVATFANEKMLFLKRDAKILPIHNVTVEELSNWFIEQIIADRNELEKNKIVDIKVKVFSSPGQSGSGHWEKKND